MASKPVSRRQFGKVMAGTVVGTLVAEDASAQTDKPATPATTDSRIALLEKGRGKPLSDDLRKAVRENLKSYDATGDKLRAFAVPDGTEPRFVFHPTPVAPKSGRPGARRDA
jgi:hypothetical protein